MANVLFDYLVRELGVCGVKAVDVPMSGVGSFLFLGGYDE